MEKFQNKYRIPSARAAFWDYGRDAAYFITICTQDQQCFFGTVVETPIYGVSSPVYPEGTSSPVYPEGTSSPVYPEGTSSPVHPEGTSSPVHPAEGVSSSTQECISPPHTHQTTKKHYTVALTNLGQTAFRIWFEIPRHFPYVKLDAFVVMPNHIHGILIIDKNGEVTEAAYSEDKQTGGFAGQTNPMLQENVSRVVRWYKGRTTFEMRKQYVGFRWQTRFYDHIIRNESSYQTIAHYIEQNPHKWAEDKFFTPL